MDTSHSEKVIDEIKRILESAIEEEDLNYIYDALKMMDDINDGDSNQGYNANRAGF